MQWCTIKNCKQIIFRHEYYKQKYIQADRLSTDNDVIHRLCFTSTTKNTNRMLNKQSRTIIKLKNFTITYMYANALHLFIYMHVTKSQHTSIFPKVWQLKTSAAFIYLGTTTWPRLWCLQLRQANTNKPNTFPVQLSENNSDVTLTFDSLITL